MIELTPATSFEMAAEQAANFAAHQAGAVRLNDVTASALRWLWPNRIPLGHVTLLAGDPGIGKSLLTLDMAARVTSGAPWPDEPADTATRLPSTALLVTAEDDLADTIRPRFEAMGGDSQRLLVIASAPDDEMEYLCATEGIRPPQRPTRPFDLTRDFGRLRTLVKALPECRLLVIDPITAYLGGTSENGNADVRQLLLPLVNLAREYQLAVVIVNHLRKRDSAAIYRTMGSMAFVAASRAAWGFTRDPGDPLRRLLVPLKSNFAADTSGLACTIESQTPESQTPESQTTESQTTESQTTESQTTESQTTESQTTESQTTESQTTESQTAESQTTGGPPVLRWSPERIAVTANEAIATLKKRGRPDDERQAAIEWLRRKLADKPQASRAIHEEAEQHGYSLRTIQRSFREIHGVAFREDILGEWYWKLPAPDRQK